MMNLVKVSVSTILALSNAFCLRAKQGLSNEQETWLQSVSFGNVSYTWPSLTGRQLDDLYAKVARYKAITEVANYPYHQAVEVWYKDVNRTEIDRYDDVGDSAAWTGLYLAALVHEYAVTENVTVLEQAWNTLRAIDFLSLCTGKPGYISRFAGLANDTIYAKYYKGYGNGAFNCASPYEEYVWLGYSSRDMYIGVAFGLANVLVHLSSNQTFVKMASDIVERVADCLEKDGFFIVSPKFQIVNPVPIFSAVWRLLAISVNSQKYNHFKYLYALDYEEAVLFELHLNSMYDDTYYPNELTLEGLYILSLLDKNDEHLNVLKDKFSEVVVKKYNHFQPGFASFYLSAITNATDYEVPQGILQGGLYDYPEAPNWDHYVDQSNNPSYIPHHDTTHSERALMIRDRPPTTYLWQRAPTILKGGENTCCFQRKHLDLLLAYWVGRSSGYF